MKKIFNRIFIDGLGGMALGLFSTLIVGTILAQIGKFIPGAVGTYLTFVGAVAKTVTGAGIGVGVASKLKASPLTVVSAAVCGMIGAFPTMAVTGYTLGAPGEPLGAFIAAYIAVEIGALVSGKTKVDIIVTPICCILAGSLAAIFVGPYISTFMKWVGGIVNYNVNAHPVIGGMLVATVMGILLTLPISSAAIGIAMNLTGLAAGAAVVGCCCNMIGFAVISYRENKFGGLIAQGVGTSMLQMPNIVRHPQIWVPAIISSAILGPVSSAVFKMTSSAVGSGMGTAGLVGPLETYFTMVESGTTPLITLLLILLMCFMLPAVISLAVSEAMRKMGWIKNGYMRLPSND
jgi:uncharacterized membrane protein